MEKELKMVSKKKSKKSEIAHTVEEAMGDALEKLEITSPSKKTEKLIRKVSKKFSGQLKKEKKKHDKEAVKAVKKPKVAKAVKKNKKEIPAKSKKA